MNKIHLLDCTLRDGGYYNAWDFEPRLIKAYVKAMAALPVDIVEIGFRSMPGAGSKLTRAQELGVEVIDEDAFLALLRGHGVEP